MWCPDCAVAARSHCCIATSEVQVIVATASDATAQPPAEPDYTTALVATAQPPPEPAYTTALVATAQPPPEPAYTTALVATAQPPAETAYTTALVATAQPPALKQAQCASMPLFPLPCPPGLAPHLWVEGGDNEL